MAEALVKYETLDTNQIDQIMDGQVPSPPADWDDDNRPGAAPPPVVPADNGNERPHGPTGTDAPIGGAAGSH
jgi:cell division protease FtsH